MALRLRSFSHPDVLKQFQPEILIRLLETSRLFFETKGLALPAGNGREIDYLSLAGILADPDEAMPADLVEALYQISELGTEENYDDLLQLAAEAGIEVPEDPTAADLTARIWLQKPELLERQEREGIFGRRKTFESFRAGGPALAVDFERLPAAVAALEASLGRYFEEKKKGAGCRVIPKVLSGEIRFLLQHGHTYRREPSRNGTESTSTFFRPERTDVSIVDLVQCELRINAASAPDLRKYRELLGLHLFGDAGTFVYAEKYTLEPLRSQGEAALRYRDIEGIEWVRLAQIDLEWGGAFESVEIQRAQDVFKALAVRQAKIPDGPVIGKAVFKVKLLGEKKPRTISVKAGNKAGYQRSEESAIIEQWLRARGFILFGTKAYAEAA